MKSEPPSLALVGSGLILLVSCLNEVKIFQVNTHKWASTARWDGIFFNQFCFFQMLIRSYKIIYEHLLCKTELNFCPNLFLMDLRHYYMNVKST